MDISHKKILITGGTGHLGSALIHYLVRERNVAPQNIRVFYLKNSPVDSLRDIEGLDFFAGNVLNAGEIEAACEDVHLVFHMIGLTTFDTRQKRLQWLVNVEGTRNTLEAVRKSKTIERLCYTSTVNSLAAPASTGSIGNFENSDPYLNQPPIHSFHSKEETLAFIQHVYENKNRTWEKQIGIGYFDSKLAAQELVNDYAHHHGLNVVSVLPGTMFGPYDYLVGTGMYLLSLYKNKMPVVLNGGLPLAHVMDVAEGHVLAMEKAMAGSSYIISGPEEDNRSFKNMCGIITEVLQQKFPAKRFRAPQIIVSKTAALAAAFVSEKYATLFNQPTLLSRDAVNAGAHFLFYTSKNATQDLGYQPQRTFRQAIEEMIDYYIKENLMENEARYVDRR
jgi:dihydroflavonol-4-reductase